MNRYGTNNEEKCAMLSVLLSVDFLVMHPGG